ncbi:MAG: hypothetical protein MZV65_28880 [Chromatiales bacterium]|nr:hypothetical protein [Chromatiales bacterium]
MVASKSYFIIDFLNMRSNLLLVSSAAAAALRAADSALAAFRFSSLGSRQRFISGALDGRGLSLQAIDLGLQIGDVAFAGAANGQTGGYENHCELSCFHHTFLSFFQMKD